MSTSSSDNSSPIIVGVGASAGGLDAFKELLGGLGDASGLAIVFVQHLDPTSKSLLSDLLGDSTPMKVVEIEEPQRLHGGIVYVCPPHACLELSEGWVSFSEPDEDRRPLVIDHFFYSVAEDQGERGVGVILSGSGSDGTLGLKAISDRGGLTFAQSSESAKFDSMPRSAATTGVADHVMKPAEIAKELLAYAKHLTEFAGESSTGNLHLQIEEAIPTIAELLMKSTQHNFQHYKTNTLIRRIQRRMQVLKISNASDYVRNLEQSEEETQSLFRELLIGVTTFFRDPEAFRCLRQNVLRGLFEGRAADDMVRIWVAGCANGSEAYTIAILCREVMDDIEQPCGVQIFATDINQRALQVARNGIYPAGIEEDVSHDRLKRFFVKRGKKYQVAKEIRDIVLFSEHNLISDPPFSRQDLISCRNLLIYLGSHLQKKLIPLFHYSLRPSGYLFLGPSENVTSHGELFRSIDVRHRISQRKGTAMGKTPTMSLRQNSVSRLAADPRQPDTATDLTAIRQRILLDEFAPKSCIIDESGQILDAAANLEKYLSINDGAFQNNIIKMAASGLRIGLRAAISDAKKTSRRITHENMSIRVGEDVQRVMITVQPMPRLGEDEPLLLIVFHDIGLPVHREDVELPIHGTGHDADAIIAQLEAELETTRQDLDTTMQDMEAANEELKSSNEELLSMNEELQSANEELETSKEEIRAGSDAVARANDDLQNLLSSTQIATVFLDQKLRIRSFTPAITDIYSLLPTDVGRPLEAFVPHVQEMPPLPAVDQLRSGHPVEHSIHANSGKSYIRRVLPYQSYTGETQGVVVTFTEITELQRSQEFFQLLVEASSQIVWIADARGKVVDDSPSWREFTGQTVEQFRGIGWLDAVHPKDRAGTLDAWNEAVQGATKFAVEYRLQHHGGDYVWMQVRAVAQRLVDGSIERWVGMNADISDRKQRETEAAEREAELRNLINNVSSMIGLFSPDGTIQEINKPALAVAGVRREEVVGKKIWDAYWFDFDPQVQAQLQRMIRRCAAGEPAREDLAYRAVGDVRRIMDATLQPCRDVDGKIIKLIGTGIDVTDRKHAEVELSDREAHLRRVINNQLGLVGVIDHEGCLVEVDDRSLAIAKVPREAVIGKHFAEAPWWTYDPAVAEQMRDAMRRAFNGEVVRYDVSLFAHGSDGVMIDFMIAPVKNDAGEIEFLIPSGVDIRDRHAAEEERRRSDQLVRTIAENSTHGLVMMDATGHVIYCNQSFLAMTGFDQDEIRSKPLHHLVHHHYPDGRPYPMCECPIDRALPEDFSVRAHEDLFFRKDGSSFPVLCAASPIFNHGKPVSTVIEVRDISEQKHQESELNRAASRLEKSMSFAGIASWGWDQRNQKLILDAQLKRMWGFDKEAEVTLEDFTSRIHEEHRDRVVDAIENAMQSYTAYREEYSIMLPSGHQRWVRAVGHAQPASDGKIEEFFGVTIDITADRRREIKARFRAELLEQLTAVSELEEIMQLATKRIGEHFHASRCYLARIRLDDRTTEVFHESHAAHLQTIVGMHQISDFLNPDELAGITEGRPVRINDIRLSGRSETKIKQLESLGIAAVTQGSFESTKQLNRTIFVTKEKPYHWRDDEVRFLDNLTEMVYLRIERAQTQKEIERARAAAEAANASKSAFVANMSHEIRTPMTAILGYADLVEELIDNDQAASHLRTIRRNGDYLLEIINDILDLSKIEADKLDIDFERFEPFRVIEDVRSIMEVRAKEGGLELEVRYNEKLPKEIESDAKRLKQILINLVGNAIKFTREGKVLIQVGFDQNSVPTSRDARENFIQERRASLVIDVIDTGIGMSEEQQRKLFKPFSQGDSSVSRHFGGTGLGLAISKRLAAMLGGRISAQSVLGKGSTFTLSISVGAIHGIELIDYRDAVIADKGTRSATSVTDELHLTARLRREFERRLANLRVLVVDDRRDIRFLSKALLTKAGATVDECEDGQLAVEHINDCLNGSTCPDVILLDMQMPNLDGYETARAMRNLGYTGPIIALTADAMQGDMNECIQAGCNDYLSKPIDAGLLIEKVAGLAARRGLEGEQNDCSRSRTLEE